MNDASWKDAHGRLWGTTVNVNTVRRVRELLDVDLLDCFDGKLFARLADDPVLLVNTLYVVCKPQADERAVSEEGFAELLVGDTITSAVNALVAGLTCFFPSERRGYLTRMWAATAQARTAAMNLADKKLDSPIVVRALDEAMAKANRQIDAQLQALMTSGGTSSN